MPYMHVRQAYSVFEGHQQMIQEQPLFSGFVEDSRGYCKLKHVWVNKYTWPRAKKKVIVTEDCFSVALSLDKCW